MNKNNKNPTSILSYLFIFLLTSASIPLSKSVFPNEKVIGKDCAFANTDYINIEERKKLVLSGTPYNNGIDTYSDFKTSYFDNLTYNFGMNYKGSCGYVAIGMLLSYYDTYLSDDIIPEQYDINSYGESNNMIDRRDSPGVLKDIIIKPTQPSYLKYGFDLSASDYYSKISSLQETSLHAKLITIGASKGYYDFSDNSSPCGTSYSNRYNVLTNYLSNVAGYKLNEDYSIVSYNGESNSSLSNNVRNFAIDQINKGNPVLLSISDALGYGHVVIAYDYDSNSDKLYCHMGWNASTTHTTIEAQSYSRYKTALAINFKNTHTHSNNYAVTTVVNNKPTTNYYCFDSSKIITYSHDTHSYIDHYAMYSSTKHKAYCQCGEYILEPHIVNSGSIYTSNGHKYGTCIGCGTTIDLNSTFVIVPSSISSTNILSDLSENEIYLIDDNDLDQHSTYKEGL